MVRPVSAVLLGLILLTGCSETPSQRIVSPSIGAAPTPSASDVAAFPDEPPGSLACTELKTAVIGATLMEPGVVDGIVSFSSTADAPVADSAQRLASAYASAVAARGSDREPDAVAAVSVAGADMTKICEESGLSTVG